MKTSADGQIVNADGKDLAFITVKVTDEDGLFVPDVDLPVTFRIDIPGEIVATDNGNPKDMTVFPSHKRDIFNGLALVIIRSPKNEPGLVSVMAETRGI